ncbi:MAG: methionyl-tRNA formyltransferase [Pleurocapsa minor GSE-CHR-MK-17-07R]|jgi:methionyl-tRNA formyltransferase|nr:methionyl-tRNA formyltransferase [Pleurocapsa minor GSE-CHR-MK 17-07R]
MSHPQRIVFMGTPDFSVAALRSLIAHFQVTGVVTQPDRPAGRGREVQMSPVKRVALEAGIPVFQPEKIRRPEAIETLKQFPADAYVVAAFGQILPQAVLDIPAFGSINIHASLLPRWRGAAPIQACIREGDAETGITIMKMDAGLDTGPMLRARALPIAPDETGASLHDKLAVLGADLLIETLPDYFAGRITPQAQDDALATLAPRIDKQDGRIDWSQPAGRIERLVRAYTPWPGTFTYFGAGSLLKILSGHAEGGSAVPGGILPHGKSFAIGTGDGLYVPDMVQPEGRKAMSFADFARGYPTAVASGLTGGA